MSLVYHYPACGLFCVVPNILSEVLCKKLELCIDFQHGHLVSLEQFAGELFGCREHFKSC